MKIKELTDNMEFCFNVHFRIYQYIPANNEEGQMILKYDSEADDGKVEVGLFDNDITAINQSKHGIVEIEYV